MIPHGPLSGQSPITDERTGLGAGPFE